MGLELVDEHKRSTLSRLLSISRFVLMVKFFFASLHFQFSCGRICIFLFFHSKTHQRNSEIVKISSQSLAQNFIVRFILFYNFIMNCQIQIAINQMKNDCHLRWITEIIDFISVCVYDYVCDLSDRPKLIALV